jgi:hypothetical protein
LAIPPARPKIYHITHIDNLPSILHDGGLLSEKRLAAENRSVMVIGLKHLKKRREHKPVSCYPDDRVWEYVPFYFCPRSEMLGAIHTRKSRRLTYSGGQRPVIHLEADLTKIVGWANQFDRRWAITPRNASELNTEDRATEFYSDLSYLNRLNWSAIESRDHPSPGVAAGKQAEFLLRDELPWQLVDRIGVHSEDVSNHVRHMLKATRHRPRVEVCPDWYFQSEDGDEQGIQ